MKYAFLVAWREYAESIKAKGFWISICMMPIMLLLSIQAPLFLEKKATPTRRYVVVDQAGDLGGVIESRIENSHQQKVLEDLRDYAQRNKAPGAGTLPALLAEGGDASPRAVETFTKQGGQKALLEQLRPLLKPGVAAFVPPRRLFESVTLPAGIDAGGSVEDIAEKLRPYLRGDKRIEVNGSSAELSAAVIIPRDITNHIVRPGAKPAGGAIGSAAGSGPATEIQFWSINASDSRFHDEIERALNSEIRRREYLARGLDVGVVRQVEQTYLPLASLNPKKEKGQEAVGTADVIRQWAPSAFVYLLWIAIFVIIQMLLNNTIEEKSNRIIEVLLSSVTPGELMMGKLFGIAAVGLTMVGAWIFAFFAILNWKGGGASQITGQILTVLKGSNLVPLFALYFLLGYLMYAAFILSIGSVCNTIKEAQSYVSVMSLLLMVPLLTMTFIPKDPNGTLARVLSWIPFYTPFTMMNRAAADPPMVDFVGTLILLAAATLLAMWMSGKVFRIGILRTGQPPKVIEMIRWALRKDG
jgi:ABC-2 type transport system permease protein